MLTDLTRVCSECRCRVVEAPCPRCAGGKLVAARLGREGLLESADRAPRATRAVKWLIAVPFGAGVVAVVVSTIATFPVPRSATGLVLAFVHLVAVPIGAGIGVLAFVGLWTLVLLAARWLATRGRVPVDPALDVALAPKPSASERWRRVERAWSSASRFVRLAPWLLGAAVFCLLWASSGDVVQAFLIVLGACVGIACIFVPGWFVLAGTLAIASYLARPPSLLRGALGRAPDEARLLALWTAARRPVEGVVTELADPALRSPLSGKPCAAARLRGFAGECRVEDAVAGEFCIETDDGSRYRVQPGPAAVLVAADEVIREPAGELEPFLRERGLPSERLRLREGRVEVGRRVRVWGRPGTSEAEGRSGYRSGAGRRLLTAADDERLVIEAR